MSSTVVGLVQLGALLLLLAAVYVPFGNYPAAVYTDERHWRVERALYRLVRVDPDSEQRWTGYAAALLAFSFLSVVLLYLMQRLQAVLPLSLGRGPVEAGIAFNTAVSLVTNTNWQSHVPEAVMGHLVQMAGLTVQNFVSAAVGMAVAVALVRAPSAPLGGSGAGRRLGRSAPVDSPRSREKPAPSTAVDSRTT